MTSADLPLSARPFRKSRRREERVRVMGAEMDLMRPEEVLYFVARKVAAGEKAIIANHNLHSLYLVRRDPELQEFFRIADLIEVDSIPILLWARLTRRGGRRFHRCTYLDWRNLFWTTVHEKGWRVFYLGAAPGVAQAGAERLTAEWPGLQIAAHDGYFDMREGSAEAEAVREEINAYAPHILLVGMGMPRQEAWIVRNHEGLAPCAIFSVGAAFDYEAGVQKAAPRWMGRVGLEWAFRLVADPGRLFRRYCVEPWFLIPTALREIVALLAGKSPAERRSMREDRRAYRPRDFANPGRRGSDKRGLSSEP